MPDARLQRTRDAYDRTPTLPELIDALPGLPLRPSHLVTDPTTGHTERIYEPSRFEPWNVIEGEEHA